MIATPADVPPGHAVRVTVFRRSVYSPTMSAAEAEQLAMNLANEVDGLGGTYHLVAFPLVDGVTARLRARQITDIAHGPLHVLKAQEPRDVQVHLHVAPDHGETVDLAGEAARAAVGVIPTPLVMAGRRQSGPRG